MVFMLSAGSVSIDNVTLDNNSSGQIQIADAGISASKLDSSVSAMLNNSYRVLLIGSMADTIIQGASWTKGASNVFRFYPNITQTSAGNVNDGVRFSNVFFKAGTYTLQTIYDKQGANGIMRIRLNSTTIASIDGYNSTNSDNALTETTGIIIASDGLYNVDIETTTKNGSASAYYMELQALQFFRTA